MKILYWSPGFWPSIGGLETHSLELTSALTARGHQCSVITQQINPNQSCHEFHNQLEIFRFPFDDIIRNKNHEIKNTITVLKKTIAKINPDIVHIQLTFGSDIFFFRLIQQELSIPVICTVHGLHYFHLNPNVISSKQLSVSKHLSKGIITACDAVTFVSNALRQQAQSYGWLEDITAEVIYNGLKKPNILPRHINDSEIINLLVLSRLTEEKGIDTAIRALSILIKENTNIQLMIAGSGADLPKLKSLTQTLKLEAHVSFIGPVAYDDRYKLINTANIVLVPSHYESFGLTAVEAMQMQKPVICSAVGGLTEIISDMNNGVLIKQGCDTELANAVLFLINNTDKAATIGSQAKKDSQRYSIETMAHKYEAAYANLMPQHQLI
ncbi:MAG: glycosyltransferase family 4 protein [Coxiellaceae bacterium]|nr:glycosyltransferase family 4 protein [Coxiellaceae bacterium]